MGFGVVLAICLLWLCGVGFGLGRLVWGWLSGSWLLGKGTLFVCVGRCLVCLGWSGWIGQAGVGRLVQRVLYGMAWMGMVGLCFRKRIRYFVTGRGFGLGVGVVQ
ncbi:hypothetical protein F5144DRAFT_564699 [Chaetomium tenue]|uniref:Uncharacterized protein n=1 Tax=Chaetomium tenue TaxID=1854479 RepID=A0ACB7PJF4_9PEZI|nr:hypothetical protein F5144DRAFT_564699 [Chaetomium globosum]